jgi:REP element-mobilizing transposase RayT
MLKLLKGRSARYCNQELGRSGAFWHHESYDHVVRNQEEYERIAWYIANNPVKAGLVENWEDWKFTFVSQDL